MTEREYKGPGSRTWGGAKVSLELAESTTTPRREWWKGFAWGVVGGAGGILLIIALVF